MIELVDVIISYRGHDALAIPEASFGNGKVTAVVGRNGSGKSTLLRALAGIIPYRGSIRVDGDELSGIPHRERARRTAYLPQTLSTPAMDVATLVSHGRFSRLGPLRAMGADDRSAVQRAMELTDVWELRDRPVSEISGGERQRAYLAMVVAQDAPMLLLDEPGAHLDVAHRRDVVRIMRRLADEGKGVVVASHDLPETFAVCNEACVINRGTIGAWGDTGSIVENDGLLLDAMGVCVRRIEGDGLLFPYALSDGDDTVGAAAADAVRE